MCLHFSKSKTFISFGGVKFCILAFFKLFKVILPFYSFLLWYNWFISFFVVQTEPKCIHEEANKLHFKQPFYYPDICPHQIKSWRSRSQRLTAANFGRAERSGWQRAVICWAAVSCSSRHQSAAIQSPLRWPSERIVRQRPPFCHYTAQFPNPNRAVAVVLRWRAECCLVIAFLCVCVAGPPEPRRFNESSRGRAQLLTPLCSFCQARWLLINVRVLTYYVSQVLLVNRPGVWNTHGFSTTWSWPWDYLKNARRSPFTWEQVSRVAPSNGIAVAARAARFFCCISSCLSRATFRDVLLLRSLDPSRGDCRLLSNAIMRGYLCVHRTSTLYTANRPYFHLCPWKNILELRGHVISARALWLVKSLQKLKEFSRHCTLWKSADSNVGADFLHFSVSFYHPAKIHNFMILEWNEILWVYQLDYFRPWH